MEWWLYLSRILEEQHCSYGMGGLIHADGDLYIGWWFEDRASGEEVYYSSCGAKFKGSWKEDKQHGYG